MLRRAAPRPPDGASAITRCAARGAPANEISAFGAIAQRSAQVCSGVQNGSIWSSWSWRSALEAQCTIRIGIAAEFASLRREKVASGLRFPVKRCRALGPFAERQRIPGAHEPR